MIPKVIHLCWFSNDLDDSNIEKTKELLSNYSEDDVIRALDLIKEITLFIKNN